MKIAYFFSKTKPSCLLQSLSNFFIDDPLEYIHDTFEYIHEEIIALKCDFEKVLDYLDDE